MTGSTVWVRHHHVSCDVYGALPVAGEAVRSAVAGPVTERLAGALQAVGGTDGYWLIRRLDVDASVAAAWSAASVAHAVAHGIVGNLAEVVRRGADEDGVLWFPDRSAFVSGFLADLAAGRARGRWEYRQFAHLLDTDDPLIRLAEAEPATVRAALLQLRAGDVELVIRLVAPHRVDDLLVALGAHGAGAQAATLVLASVRELARSGLLDERTALRLTIRAARANPAAEFGAIAATASTVGSIVHVLQRASDPTSLAAALAAGQWRAAVEGAGAESTDDVLALVSWPAAQRRELCRLITDPFGTDGHVADVWHTPFGGMFLLLPIVDELCDWPVATKDWPASSGVPAHRLARLLAIGASLGRAETVAPLLDPVLRAALGVPQHLEVVDFVSWLAEIEPHGIQTLVEAVPDLLPAPGVVLAAPFADSVASAALARLAHTLLRALGRRLPGMADASPPYFWTNVLDFPARVQLDDDRAIAELGNPPLHVLLSMTGLNRGSFRLAGCGDRVWTLTTRS